MDESRRLLRERQVSWRRAERALLRFVRRLHRYYGGVRLLGSVHHRLRLLAFTMRADNGSTVAVKPETSQLPMRSFCTCDVAFDPGRASAPHITVPHMLPSSE